MPHMRMYLSTISVPVRPGVTRSYGRFGFGLPPAPPSPVTPTPAAPVVNTADMTSPASVDTQGVIEPKAKPKAKPPSVNGIKFGALLSGLARRLPHWFIDGNLIPDQDTTILAGQEGLMRSQGLTFRCGVTQSERTAQVNPGCCCIAANARAHIRVCTAMLLQLDWPIPTGASLLCCAHVNPHRRSFNLNSAADEGCTATRRWLQLAGYPGSMWHAEQQGRLAGARWAQQGAAGVGVGVDADNVGPLRYGGRTYGAWPEVPLTPEMMFNRCGAGAVHKGFQA